MELELIYSSQENHSWLDRKISSMLMADGSLQSLKVYRYTKSSILWYNYTTKA